MVRYYGRAKQRVGSVNTPQLGLKMSGCPSKIGKRGSLVRYQSRRAQCNLKFYGPVRYHGVLWSFNSGPNTVPRQSKCAANAGGVGRINAPRFECSKQNKIKEYYQLSERFKERFWTPGTNPIPPNFVLYSGDFSSCGSPCCPSLSGNRVNGSPAQGCCFERKGDKNCTKNEIWRCYPPTLVDKMDWKNATGYYLAYQGCPGSKLNYVCTKGYCNQEGGACYKTKDGDQFNWTGTGPKLSDADGLTVDQYYSCPHPQ